MKLFMRLSYKHIKEHLLLKIFSIVRTDIVQNSTHYFYFIYEIRRFKDSTVVCEVK